MKLRVACNWDPALLEGLAGLPVASIFGNLAADVVGGGRPTQALPEVEREAARAFIEEARSRGLGFNYLLNGACLGNREFTSQFHDELDQLLDWIVAAGATEVTVTVPVLVRRIKQRHPELKVCCSIFNRVASVRQAQLMEELGYDNLVLESMSCNRDLALIEAIRQAVDCELTLLTNVQCIYECPLRFYHANADAHSSQQWQGGCDFRNKYCFLHCTAQRFQDPVEFVRTPWIRPEDLALYEELGVDSFKVAERTRDTGWILRAARAYAARRYDGDLHDLINYPEGMLHYMVGRHAPGTAVPEHLTPILDNRALDGFLEFFRTCDCRHRNCDECGYCARVARKALKVPEGPLVAEAFAEARDRSVTERAD